VTRGEFVTFLYRVAGEPGVSGSHNFRDVPAGRFYSTPVLWAVRNGVTTGLTATSFAPDESITREQLATMLHRYIAGGEPAPADVLGGYIDHTTISTWAGARAAVNWAAYYSVMGYNTNRLNPRGNANRSEAMAMIKRVVDVYGLSLSNPWSSPFQTVPAIPTRPVSLPPMETAELIEGTLSVGVPLITHDFTISDAGGYRFVLTGIERGGSKVEFRVLRESGSSWTEVTDFIPLGYREAHAVNMSAGNYRVLVGRHEGSQGSFALSVLRQKPRTNITSANRDTINVIQISDFMEFERQQNVYLFHTPEATGSGFQNPGGIYRFDLGTVPSEVGIRTTIRLEVFLERGMVPVVGPVDLALFDGVNGELRDNETYIIRTTQIPIADSTSGTVMSDSTPYTLRVGVQKNVTEISPMSANAASRTSRVSVVNDSFQFTGQMNTYIFTAPSTGTFQFRPNLMHGRSEFRISDPWGYIHSRTIGVGENISQHFVTGVTYRMHIINQPGTQTGNYSFTIVYP
jgi:hypothetical protein